MAYSKEFKEEALKYADSFGKKKAAEKYGIEYDLITTWDFERSQSTQDQKKDDYNKGSKIHVAKIKIPWGIIPIILVLSVAIGYFFSTYCNDKAAFNMENTDVDFIIQAPSADQVREIAGLPHIDAVTPYYYKAINVIQDSKTVMSNLFVIESEDKLSNTVFSEKLKISCLHSTTKNPVYISDDIANTLNVDVGDIIVVALNNSQIEYSIKGIFRSDGRNVGGTLIAIFEEDTKNTIGEGAKYNGAYICSNDNAASKAFLESYKPEGDLRSRDEFDSDEQYQLYLENRSKNTYSSSTFETAAFIKEQHNRKDSKVSRDLLLTILFAIIALTLICAFSAVPANRYVNKVLQSSKKNGATYKHVSSSIGSFFGLMIVAVGLSFLLGGILNLLIWNVPIISVINTVGIISLILVLVIWIVKIQKIKNKSF